MSSSAMSPILAELKRLREWKESAITVLNGIDLQEVGKQLGLPLGSDIGPAILPAIKRVQQLRELIADVQPYIPMKSMPVHLSGRIQDALSPSPSLAQALHFTQEKADNFAQLASAKQPEPTPALIDAVSSGQPAEKCGCVATDGVEEVPFDKECCPIHGDQQAGKSVQNG